MRTRLRALGLALIAWAILASPVLSGPQTALRDAAARFERAHLQHDSVLALLLLLLSEEEARVHAQLQALYDAGYVSTAPAGSYPIERYLAGALAARYSSEVQDDVFSVMLEYLRMMTQEVRQDRPSRPDRLKAATVRIGSALAGDRLDRFVQTAHDWLRYLERSVAQLKQAELEMLQLQTLVSARQQVLQLTANLLAALDAAARQIAANMGNEGQSSDPPASLSEGESDSAGDASGSGACVSCDGGP
jgi:hypothetical protein